MVKINQIKISIDSNFDNIYKKIQNILKLKTKDIDFDSMIILRKTVDYRDKNNICFVYNIAVKLNIDEKKYLDNIKNNNITIYENKPLLIDKNKIVDNKIEEYDKPIIVGFGPSGIFCAYILTLFGINPIVLERGKSIEERDIDVKNFIKSNILNENSNISFGEGGAGTYSDGKLNTRINDNNGFINFVLETFVKFGADENILYESDAHIGTDKLKIIITNIRNYLLEKGVIIKYNYKWTYEDEINNKYKGPKVLSIGNCSRDTFINLINNKFEIQIKPFAIGFRVAHNTELINNSIYVKNYNEVLGNAHYKLINHINDKTIYSFCMCPGGYIINSSSQNNLTSINGMSFSDRNNIFSNSAIVININENDVKSNNPIDFIKFQEKYESKNYRLSNGKIPYCFLSNFKNNDKINHNIDNIDKCFYGQYEYNPNLVNIFDDIGFNFNDLFVSSMNKFSNNINCFNNDNTIVAGIETKTSSPIKLDRNENLMTSIHNYYPCGEGLGHGGGIVSCAVDGLKVGLKIIERYKNGI